MKTLRSISTAALLSLVFASTASAVPANISISATPSVASLGTIVSYTVSGSAEVKETYEVRLMHVGVPSANCAKARPEESTLLHAPFEVEGKAATPIAINRTEVIPVSDYATTGTYVLCARILKGASAEGETYESSTSFTVEAPAPSPSITPAPAPPAPAVVSTPVTTVHATASTAQKLHAALAKCKKQKNSHKRKQCERRARSSHR